jgi:hypothetical protein
MARFSAWDFADTTVNCPWTVSGLFPMACIHRISLALALSMAVSLRAEDSPGKPLNFVNDIVPILTKADCNTGGCHAKAITGQRGFRLSLLGF